MQFELPCDQYLRAYSAALMISMPAAVIVPRVSLKDADFEPRQQYCHENIRTWVAAHPDYKAVPGWLYFDLMHANIAGQQSRYEFLAHSVLEDPQGNLLDITPVDPGAAQYPFIKASSLPDAEQWGPFYEMINHYPVGRLRIIPTEPPVLTYLNH